MFRLLAILGSVISIALGLFGLPQYLKEIPENAETWRCWLSLVANMVDQDFARWIFALVGLIAIATIHFWPRFKAKRIDSEPNPEQESTSVDKEKEDSKLSKRKQTHHQEPEDFKAGASDATKDQIGFDLEDDTDTEITDVEMVDLDFGVKAKRSTGLKVTGGRVSGSRKAAFYYDGSANKSDDDNGDG